MKYKKANKQQEKYKKKKIEPTIKRRIAAIRPTCQTTKLNAELYTGEKQQTHERMCIRNSVQ